MSFLKQVRKTVNLEMDFDCWRKCVFAFSEHIIFLYLWEEFKLASQEIHTLITILKSSYHETSVI